MINHPSIIFAQQRTTSRKVFRHLPLFRGGELRLRDHFEELFLPEKKEDNGEKRKRLDMLQYRKWRYIDLRLAEDLQVMGAIHSHHSRCIYHPNRNLNLPARPDGAFSPSYYSLERYAIFGEWPRCREGRS